MIKIQNIYYMLAYAFKNLNEIDYMNIGNEEFENVADMLAVLLIKEIDINIKRGLRRDYVSHEERVSSPKGKIVIGESIKHKSILSKKLICEYDEFFEDIYINQIVKTTMLLLIHCSEVQVERKQKLKKNLFFFQAIREINPYTVTWTRIKYNRHNINYKMLINICYLIIEGMLLNKQKGNKQLRCYIDDQKMSSLYERFVRAYYKKHYPNYEVSAAHIHWCVEASEEENMFLPIMKSDITIRNQKKILIIDTKYYSQTMQNHTLYNKHTFHSSNMYQIFTYVKNKSMSYEGSVSGVVLYARTEEDITPNHEYNMSGNKISIKTLNLDQDFSQIKWQLDRLVEDLK